MPKPPPTPNTDAGLRPRHSSNVHWHADEQGVLHRCYHKCRSWLKIAIIVLVTDVICELITFLPIHRLFQALGWIH